MRERWQEKQMSAIVSDEFELTAGALKDMWKLNKALSEKILSSQKDRAQFKSRTNSGENDGDKRAIIGASALEMFPTPLQIQLESLLRVFKFMLIGNKEKFNDYRIVLQDYKDFEKKERIINLGLWCMNPAIGFKTIASISRSVILTSGTLDPLDSFASELSTSFPVVLKAGHVVPKDARYAVVVTNRQYTFMERGDMGVLDGLGRDILNITKRVPAGLLCFFPSYSFLTECKKRFKDTGLWEELGDVKDVYEGEH